jgi:hypothetical protein
LFKGRLFWLSTRDDYLVFPLTANNNKAACMGSDKGCLNIVAVTTDGGKTIRSMTYGSNTQDPNGDTKDYDMLVTDDGFYLIYYRGKGRVYPVVYRWDFDKENWLGVVKSEDEYSLLRPGEEKPVGGFFKIDMSKFYPKKERVKCSVIGSWNQYNPQEVFQTNNQTSPTQKLDVQMTDNGTPFAHF